MKKGKGRRPADRPINPEERSLQLAKLRDLLSRVHHRALMGELAPALLKMLDSKQIDFITVSRNQKLEKAFVPVVNPPEIAELLPLVTHPLSYSMFRFFLEGLLYIPSLKGHEE